MIATISSGAVTRWTRVSVGSGALSRLYFAGKKNRIIVVPFVSRFEPERSSPLAPFANFDGTVIVILLFPKAEARLVPAI